MLLSYVTNDETWLMLAEKLNGNNFKKVFIIYLIIERNSRHLVSDKS